MRKYRNKKVEVDGRLFDSKKEAQFYGVLKLQKKAGEILEFECQPKFELQAPFKNSEGKHLRAITYTADFLVYHDGYREVVDVKGMQTETFKIKWKMLQYMYRNEKDTKFTII